MAPGDKLVQLADPNPFDATQLIDRTALRRRLPKAHRIHLAHDLQPGVLIKGKTRLIQQTVGAGASRLTSRIEPDARLADPDDECARTRGECDRCMADACTRFEHQACKTA